MLQETLTTPGLPLWLNCLLLPGGIGLQAVAIAKRRCSLQWSGATLVLLLALVDRDVTLAMGQLLALLLWPACRTRKHMD